MVLPELFVTGYPPEDLVLKPAFIEAVRVAVEAFAVETADGGPAVVMGTTWPNTGLPSSAGADLDGLDERPFNAVVLLDGGKVEGVRFKADLPNYGPFDEKRVFAAGPMPGPVSFRGVRLGLPICEDIWGPDIVECLQETGAEILISPNGSPFEWRKPDVRLNVAVSRVTEAGLPLVFVNQVGGQDELVFDGASFVLNADGSLAAQLAAWAEAIAITEWEKGPDGWRCRDGEKAVVPEGDAAAYHATVRCLRDYVDKNGFPGVVLGLSGGVDSALCAAIATDALGPERVHAVMLPYKFTSNESFVDAEACAKALGIRYDTVGIAPAVEGLYGMLQPMFAGKARDIAEENIQSRVRGTTL
ncbi:MAG: NAD(+) synthase, partial [Proteobacteria bacterium]|nr:NAD(+) synthase [Pseudomonadota bacterium]